MRIAISVSKRTAMFFAKTCRRFPKPQTVQLCRSQSTVSTLAVIWGWRSRHCWPGCFISTRRAKKWSRYWECCVLSWAGRVVSPSETEFCFISSWSVQWWISMIHPKVRRSLQCQAAAGLSIQVSSFCYQQTFCRKLVNGKFTNIWVFYSSPITSQPWPRVSTPRQVVWTTSYFENSADIYAERGLTQVAWSQQATQGQSKRWPIRHNESRPALFS